VTAYTIVGIVLAAGESRRMGRPKALLPVRGSNDTFITRILSTLRAAALDDIVVVGRAHDDALREEVARCQDVSSVNAMPEQGQLSSLIVGIQYAQTRGADAAMMLPVDMPLVTTATVSTVLETFRRTGAPIVRAAHAGRHGHPVIFSASVFDDLRNADLAEGAKAVLRTHHASIVDVEVDDPGVLRDVDLPEEYERWV
jgi:molybdenum cofactor cytidylyltransferase